MLLRRFEVIEERSESEQRRNARWSGRGHRHSTRFLASIETMSRCGGATFGETIGLAHDIPKADDLIDRIVAEASDRLMRFAPALAA